MLALLAQAPTNFPSGPEGLERYLSAFYLMFGLGFLIAAMGHLFKSRTMVISGIGLIFIGTGLFVVAIGSYD